MNNFLRAIIMNDILKAARLDLSLIKPYAKKIWMVLAVPTVFSAINRSLMTEVSFAMCLIAMTAGYTFSISEKNGMERLYGVLPISRKDMVLGRYLYTFSMGFLTVLFSITVQPLVLRALGETVRLTDICLAAVIGIFMYTLYTVFQLPGYYKFGAINGRILIFVPTVGYLAVLLLISKFDLTNNPVITALIGRPILSVIAVLVICIIANLLSIMVSINIIRKKEV